MKSASLSFPKPLTSVDVVIFAMRNDVLSVLLVQRGADPGEPFPHRWALPGGFIDIDRDADLAACARRRLIEKTGVASPYLEQLGSWGGAQRDPRGWSVTHAYFALLPNAVPTDAAPKHGGNHARWYAANDALALALAFDHVMILNAALERLRAKVEYTSLPAYLLPEEFTLGDLQQSYERVLGRSLEKSAFRTRVLAAKLVKSVPRVRLGSNRPAQLYRLRQPDQPLYFARTLGTARTRMKKATG